MPDQVAECVVFAIARVKRIAPTAVSLDKTFAELGLDSLDAINLMFEIEEKLQISIPDSEVRSLKDVRGVVEGIQKLLTAGVQANDGHS